MRKEGRTTVNEFAELGHSLYEVGVDEVSNPLGRLLTVLRLKLDFEYTVPTTQIESSARSRNCKVHT